VLYTSCLAYAILQGIVSPALPQFQAEYDTDQTTVTWVLTAYLLSASVLTPILGRAGDALGKRLMMLVALGSLAVGSLVAALAPNIGVLIVARVIQGAGGAVLPLAFGIIRDTFPDKKVNGQVGIIAGLSAAGAGVGAVLAGPTLDLLGLRWLFWIPFIVLCLALAAAYRYVPHLEPAHGDAGRVNLLAAGLLSIWLVALLLAVSQGGTWGWGSGRTISLFLLAIAVAATWVTYESRSRVPLIDMRMMRIRAVWTTNVAALLIGVGMYAYMAILPSFVQSPRSGGYGFDSSVTGTALFSLPQMVTMFVFGLLSAGFARRLGARGALVLGCWIAGGGMAIIGLAHQEAWEIYFCSAVMGVGIGLAFSAMSMVIVQAVPAHQTGVASGMNANIRTIGGSIGAAMVASVVTSQVSPDGLPLERGYTIAFLMLAACTFAAGVAALLIPGEPVDTGEHRVISHPELAAVAAGTVVDESEHPGRE
jgi:MFS family permease